MCRVIHLLLLSALALTACDMVSAPLVPQAAPAAPTSALQAPPVEPSATAPPIPAPVLLQRAMAARAAADDDATAADLSALLQAHPDAPEALAARYYLAEAYAARDRWTSAAELLRAFLAAAPADDPLRAPALFRLARAQESAGDHAGAVVSYLAYRALGTAIAPYAAARQAAQEQAMGEGDAVAGYLAAARAPIARGERAGAYEKAIALLREAGRPADALALYAELLPLADEPAYRARLLAEAADLAEAQGQPEQARTLRLEILTRAAETPQAAAAADRLVAEGGAPDPAAAARAYLNAERWGDALAQLDLASAAQPADPATRAELGRLRGLALRAQGDYPGALAALADAGAQDPNGTAGREAQLAWVQTVGQSGDLERAIQGYGEFAAAYPDDPLAPEALSRIVTLRERLGDPEATLQARLDLGRRYPASDEGRAALHQAGIALLMAQRLDEAAGAWAALRDGNAGPARARGAFWLARVSTAKGASAAAEDLLRDAATAAPASYEGARAAEELGVTPQGALPVGAPIPPEQWAELEAWAATWAGERSAQRDDVDERAERARLLAEVGLTTEANNEWLGGVGVEASPWANLALARAAHAAGMPYAALLAADALADQAPPTATTQPQALRRLLYPTPYPELVRREAAERDLDPRLLYALLRQESLFNPAATSWVGARGLGQVMPETGQGIAQNLGVADYTPDDLYRPAVSIRFAAFYLGRRIEDMSGSVHGALAAYNGGLGNAQRWAGGSTVADPDLFTEMIDYAETRGYVRAVYGHWGAYQGLYAP